MKLLRILAYILMGFASLDATANPQQHLNQGDQLAQQFLNQIKRKKQVRLTFFLEKFFV